VVDGIDELVLERIEVRVGRRAGAAVGNAGAVARGDVAEGHAAAGLDLQGAIQQREHAQERYGEHAATANGSGFSCTEWRRHDGPSPWSTNFALQRRWAPTAYTPAASSARRPIRCPHAKPTSLSIGKWKPDHKREFFASLARAARSAASLGK